MSSGTYGKETVWSGEKFPELRDVTKKSSADPKRYKFDFSFRDKSFRWETSDTLSLDSIKIAKNWPERYTQSGLAKFVTNDYR